MKTKKVLILGATGMLGHTLFTELARHEEYEVHATVRNTADLSKIFGPNLLKKVHSSVDTDNFDSILRVLGEIKPEVVINCIGIIKQLPAAKDPIISISVNSLFPHRLALACKSENTRLIHISTDCVFKGDKGNYTETDQPDADDLYGRTKFLGEVLYPHCVTLRTSIIGHELKRKYGLIDWFLSQQGPVRGFTKAIYTGFPTVEMANIIASYVIPNRTLTGLYHVSSEPISKFDLLKLVADRYGKQIVIDPYEDFRCDRSLDSSLFRNTTGYKPPNWVELVKSMHHDFMKSKSSRKETMA